LVFTIGVFIHIHPDKLLEQMTKMFYYLKKYILIGEHFSSRPIPIEYRGEKEKLFKRDFIKLFLESFEIKLLDHCFLWGHLYGIAGFDDLNWRLSEKR
jgi:spore coat polysaccharide biosynthesis protein SpsF